MSDTAAAMGKELTFGEATSIIAGYGIGGGILAVPYLASLNPEQLAAVSLDGLKEAKLGFRARYVAEFARRVVDGDLDLVGGRVGNFAMQRVAERAVGQELRRAVAF